MRAAALLLLGAATAAAAPAPSGRRVGWWWDAPSDPEDPSVDALVEFCGVLTDAAGRLGCRHERVTLSLGGRAHHGIGVIASS